MIGTIGNCIEHNTEYKKGSSMDNIYLVTLSSGTLAHKFIVVGVKNTLAAITHCLRNRRDISGNYNVSVKVLLEYNSRDKSNSITMFKV